MCNWFYLERDKLKRRHYTLQATTGNYFSNLRPGVLQDKIESSGEDFCVIIGGDPEIEDDFYSIPFKRIIHLLVPEHLAPGENSRFVQKRWLCDIRDHQFNVYPGGKRRNGPNSLSVDVADCYGNRGVSH